MPLTLDFKPDGQPTQDKSRYVAHAGGYKILLERRGCERTLTTIPTNDSDKPVLSVRVPAETDEQAMRKAPGVIRDWIHENLELWKQLDKSMTEAMQPKPDDNPPPIKTTNAVKVNVTPVITERFHCEVPFQLSVYVRVPVDFLTHETGIDDPLVLRPEKQIQIQRFLEDRVRTAAMITYMADFERLRAESCNDFNWGDYADVIETISSIGVYKTPEDVEAAGAKILKEEVTLMVNHDELLGCVPEKVTCMLIAYNPNAEQQFPIFLGPVSYDSREAVVYTQPTKGLDYVMNLPDGRQVPIYKKDDEAHPNGFKFA